MKYWLVVGVGGGVDDIIIYYAFLRNLGATRWQQRIRERGRINNQILMADK
jgi:hypothetical protein